MKKMKSKLISVFVVVGMALMPVFGFVGCGGSSEGSSTEPPVATTGTEGIMFGEVGSNTYEVVGYVGSEKDVTIPSLHNGKNVVGITSEAFRYSDIKSIVIPDPVEYIEDSAFYGCEILSSVSFPSSLRTICSRAFYQCSALNNISLPDGITDIGVMAFNLTGHYGKAANWQDGLYYVGKYCVGFDYEKLGSTVKVKEGTLLVARDALMGSVIELPDSLRYFCGLSSSDGIVSMVSDIKLGGNIKYMRQCIKVREADDILVKDNYLLDVGRAVESVRIDKDIKLINVDAFNSANATKSLAEITVDSDNPVYYSQNNCVIERATKKLVAGCKNSIIPNDVKEIGDGVFSGCGSGEFCNIPDGVTAIGDYVYDFSVEELTIPDSVKTIGILPMAIFGNSVLRLGKGVERIGVSSSEYDVYYTGTLNDFCKIKISGFSNLAMPKTPFKNLYINNTLVTEMNVTGVERLGAVVPHSVTKLTLGDSVKTLDSFSLSEVTALDELRIGSGLKLINQYTMGYRGGKAINNLYFDGTVADWCSVVFPPLSPFLDFYGMARIFKINGNDISELVIPEGVTSIPDCAFLGVSGITSVTIPDSVTYIGENAFLSCSNLSSATFATTAGWKYGIDTDVEAASLQDPATAATYLKKGIGDDDLGFIVSVRAFKRG